MSSLDQTFLRVAKCGRVVGLKGEIALWPISNVEQRFVVNAEFFLEDQISVVIEQIRKLKDHFVVKFVGLDSREDVERLVNQVLFASPLSSEVLLDGEYFHHDTIGKIVIDQDGNSRGRVEKVIESAASDLMQTDAGALIPFRFIVELNETNIHVEVPEGLFDIYEEKK